MHSIVDKKKATAVQIFLIYTRTRMLVFFHSRVFDYEITTVVRSNIIMVSTFSVCLLKKRMIT